MKIMKIGWTVLLSGFLFNTVVLADVLEWKDIENAAKSAQKKSNPSPAKLRTDGVLESSTGEAGEICSSANKVSYRQLKYMVNVDKVKFELKKSQDDKTKEILEARLPVTKHTCFCPRLQAYKQDGKIFVVVENDFFNQNKDWLYETKENKKVIKEVFRNSENKDQLKSMTELIMACDRILSEGNETPPTKCAGGYNNSTSNNRIWKFEAEIITAKGEKKDAGSLPEGKALNEDLPPGAPPVGDLPKDAPNKDKTVGVTKSVPIFYLTPDSVSDLFNKYPANTAKGVSFDSNSFEDDVNDCGGYIVENFPPDPKKQVEGKEYRYVTLSIEDQMKLAQNDDCEVCKDFYDLHKNDTAFYSELNKNLSKILDSMNKGTQENVEKALKDLVKKGSCKTTSDRDDIRDKAKDLISAMEKYDDAVLTPLWKDLQEQRAKLKKAKDSEKSNINERIDQLKRRLGQLDKMSDMDTAIKRLAACNLTYEGERVSDIRNKSYYYSTSSNSATDKDIKKKIDRDREQYNKYADEEKKEYLARTGEKKFSSNYLYKSKVYQQKANLASSSYQQKLIELQSACATNVFGYQTNPVRCNALQKQLANLQKQSTLTSTYYNNLATKAQDNAASYLNLEAKAKDEIKGSDSRISDIFKEEKDSGKTSQLLELLMNKK